MPSPLTIGCFLEDIAQEQFITSLVQRVASDLNVPVASDVRNATGGKGRVMDEFQRYLRDAQRGRVTLHPVLVVVIDGNCMSHLAKRRQIEQAQAYTGYAGTIVCAVPDPHIERWYLADTQGFGRAIQGSRPPELPAYKCERDRYKHTLRQAFHTAGIEPQLGGAEYAGENVAQMDLYRAGQTDSALKHFLDDLRVALQPFAGAT
jgi:hypothetical protein